MKLSDVKIKAKQFGIESGKKNKTILIREIQVKEGNNPCYQSEIAATCGIANCLWKDDCSSQNPNN